MEILYTNESAAFTCTRYTDGSTTIARRSQPEATLRALTSNECHQIIALLIIAESHPSFPAESFWMQILALRASLVDLRGPVQDVVDALIQDICLTVPTLDEEVAVPLLAAPVSE